MCSALSTSRIKNYSVFSYFQWSRAVKSTKLFFSEIVGRSLLYMRQRICQSSINHDHSHHPFSYLWKMLYCFACFSHFPTRHDVFTKVKWVFTPSINNLMKTQLSINPVRMCCMCRSCWPKRYCFTPTPPNMLQLPLCKEMHAVQEVIWPWHNVTVNHLAGSFSELSVDMPVKVMTVMKQVMSLSYCFTETTFQVNTHTSCNLVHTHKVSTKYFCRNS